jgi:hypothetical protein
MVSEIPDVGLVLGVKARREEEEEDNDWEIGGFGDWVIGRFGNLAIWRFGAGKINTEFQGFHLTSL